MNTVVKVSDNKLTKVFTFPKHNPFPYTLPKYNQHNPWMVSNHERYTHDTEPTTHRFN